MMPRLNSYLLNLSLAWETHLSIINLNFVSVRGQLCLKLHNFDSLIPNVSSPGKQVF